MTEIQVDWEHHTVTLGTDPRVECQVARFTTFAQFRCGHTCPCKLEVPYDPQAMTDVAIDFKGYLLQKAQERFAWLERHPCPRCGFPYQPARPETLQ